MTMLSLVPSSVRARQVPVRELQAAADTSIGTSYELLRRILSRSGANSAGVEVTPDSAMTLAAVYACVRLLSEDIAALPLKVYRFGANGDREYVADHWLQRLLLNPNSWQTGFEFRDMQQAHIELSGVFYALKTFVRDEVRELLPVPPYRMQCKLDNNYSLSYTMTLPNGTSTPVPASMVYCVRGMTLDGINCLSPIGYQRETVGLGLAMTRATGKLFSQGTLAGGVVQRPAGKPLSEPAEAAFLEAFNAAFSGTDNAFKTMLLQEGMTFESIGLSSKDAQFLESRKFNRSEIAGMYRVPAHLINDLEKATFSNIEQQSIDYVQKAIVPRISRIEAAIQSRLVAPGDQGTLYVEHMVDGMLRGDMAARFAAYQSAIINGWMTRNEVRRLQNLNAGPKELDVFLTPVSNAQASPDTPKPGDTAT